MIFYDLWIIDFYHNESTLLIFVVINLTLSVLNMIHVFIWHKWNKIIWIETTKKRKIFFPWKIIFLYPIDLDVYYDKSMYTILNLLKVMLRFWWFWWFDILNLNEFYPKSWSWFRDIYKLRFIMNQDFFINRSPKIFFWLFKRRFFKRNHVFWYLHDLISHDLFLYNSLYSSPN